MCKMCTSFGDIIRAPGTVIDQTFHASYPCLNTMNANSSSQEFNDDLAYDANAIYIHDNLYVSAF